MSTRITVAVVGGGIAGLVAARELALGGAEVSLYERASELGGRVRSTALAGAPIDIGAEAFATRGGAVMQLIEELRLASEVVRPEPLGSWVVTEERSLPLPPGGALGIPSAPLGRASRRVLGTWGALRAALEPLLPRDRTVDRATTLADLVRRRLGERVLDRLVRPVALGVYSTAPEELSLSRLRDLAEAYEREGSLIRAARSLRDSSSAAGGAVAALRGGMAGLVTALAADLERLGVSIHTGHSVEHLGTFAPDGAEPADTILLATPEVTTRALLASSDADSVGDDQPRELQPGTRVEVIALAIEDSRLDAAPRGTGALVAPGTPGIAAKALTHVTAKWADRRAMRDSSVHVVRLSYGRAGSEPETVALSDAEAYELARQDASRILGVELRADAIRDAARKIWVTSTATDANQPLTPQPGIGLAGDWVHGTGLASVVPGARQAARALLAEAQHTLNESDESQVRST
ncbi:protoporphyrinogen/coproporphyrinogen oxidase [Leucobacter denitrificans]|uniref:FAD-dependent oxidoreductase n=1 Tax=Leucobacter denitrificans TaxID=683042 RepID=A0A7G9S736_9MICO|nr:FAD-dependent oxidoreductase [Leucobacter denitrificans]QNN63661.1 FAD-dependent oxidoreductase [Leucobacter denitrificans]